jgi:hypothetical protein
MKQNRVKISSVLQGQFPSFVRDENPLLIEFLSEYYNYLESPGNPADILQNIDVYKDLDFLVNSKESTKLTQDLDLFDFSVFVESTEGFPESNGLLKINDEIIHYKSKTETSFDECTRGFSGNVSYENSNKKDSLVFEDSFASFHELNSVVVNLNNILLQEFLLKAKSQFLPGFENRELYSEVNQSLFIKQAKDFYSSKGTDDSFKILFKALFGEEINIIRPKEFLIKPSSADYRVTLDLVVERISGDPYDALNKTLYQDQDGEVPKAYGTINQIEDFVRDGRNYYRISLDYGYSKDVGVNGSVFGEFSIHPQTQLVNSVSVGSSVIDVDSTLSFADSGQLLFVFDGIDLEDDFVTVDYTSKSTTQFFGCSGIDRTIDSKSWVSANQYIYSYDNDENEIRMRVGGVLSELDVLTDTPYSSPNDYVRIKTLGTDTKDIRANTWLFNIPTSNRIFEVLNEGNLNYNMITFDDCNLNDGDIVELNFQVLNFDGSREIINKEFEVKIGSIPKKSFRIVNDRPIIDAYYVRRKLSKAKGTQYSANVQNTYVDYSGSTYVTAHSLPNYFNEDLDNDDRSIILSGVYDGEIINSQNHGFLTGDAVVYNSFSENNDINLIKNVYFVYKIDNNSFKLARSRPNIDKNIFINLEGSIEHAKLIPNSQVDENLQVKLLDAQKLIRKISSPVIAKSEQIIDSSDRIGIFQNGVEIQTYKTSEYVYYGPIQKVISTSNGTKYDLINPPLLDVLDINGSGFSGYPVITGSLERIDIVDSGFDYITAPKITISGGNGKNADAVPEMVSVEHILSFNSSSTTSVDLINNTIDFATSHKFRDGELATYNSDGQTSVGGLITNASYFIGVLSKTKISFHKTEQEAWTKTNKIDLTSLGVGNHRIISSNYKSIVANIKVLEPGSGYSNNKVVVSSSGINTSNYTITSENHGFSNGEKVVYEYSSSGIVGLSSVKNYFITKVDNNTFRLSEELENSNTANELFLRGEFVRLSSSPDGTHTFKYPPIVVTIDGIVGVSSIFEQESKCVINPIFRGGIVDVKITSKGNNYGSNNIINNPRQPKYDLLTGENALVRPIIYDGRIVEVVVLNSGKNYYSTPDLNIINSEGGAGAVITPIISDGKLISVKVIRSGIGYGNNTKINVISPATGSKLEFKIKSWNVNLVESLILRGKISGDDSVMVSSKHKKYGLQYTHAYAPRKLRNLIYSKKLEEGVIKYQTDLQSDTRTPYHSPIIGWAYDGNPIYGPYGYDTAFGGRIRQMVSGYEKIDSGNRPDYPLGFFVEDYVFTGKGDLDKNNGRFCITPEFPNGTYAYFSTLEPTLQKEGAFALGKAPAFPYILGENYNSEYIIFNKETTSNQDDYGINRTNWRRNINPYNLNNQDSGYEYLLDPNRLEKHYSIVEYSGRGKIDDIEILSSGSNYKVNDPVIFTNDFTNGLGASAKVTEIKGKNVSSISNTLKYFSNVELAQTTVVNGVVGFCTSPHGLLGGNKVKVVGFSSNTGADIDTFEPIKIRYEELILTSNISDSSATGIVTYFNVSGSLEFPFLVENDIFQINSEKVKILKVDSSNSRNLRVLVEREYDNTVGSAHSTNDRMIEIPRKFYLNNSELRQSLKTINVNRELYFIPSDSVGLGTQVGLAYTASLTNPGIGLTQINIQTQTIYIKDHGLSTGDAVVYNPYEGSPIQVYNNGVITSLQSASNEENGALYVVRIDNNIIGLSTVKLGISSVSSFVGLTTTIGDDTLFFVGVGTNYKHSLKTVYPNVLNSEVFHNTATVYTSENHDLQKNDYVSVIVRSGGEKTVDIRYNNKHRRLVSDPKTFDSSDVDIQNSTIYIENHDYSTGDKVIYISNDPAVPSGGLTHDEIYFVVYETKDKIQLANSYYNSTVIKLDGSNLINLTSIGSGGTLLKINPQIVSPRNKKIKFLLNDTSLSYVDGTSRYSAFKFKIFTDKELKTEFLSDGGVNSFQVKYNGNIGIDENAYAELTVTDRTPFELYYNLIPLDDPKIPAIKKEIISDDINVYNKNCLLLAGSNFIGRHKLVSVGSTSFNFELKATPEQNSYTTNNASISYITDSKSSVGGIETIIIESGGKNYESLVGVATVFSDTGIDAKIKPKSNSIGSSNKFKIQEIGFDYPPDRTLRPTAKLPDVLEVNQKFSFDTITLKTKGFNYIVPPDLIAKDSVTDKVLSDSILSNSESGVVTIIKNTNNLSNNTPKIIPINNSNGYSIKDINFDFATKNVTIYFKTSFSSLSDFPFNIGDNIFVEGCATKTLGSLGRGFNSADFNYDTFKIISRDPNIGGSNGSITYNLTNHLSLDETLGLYDEVSSTGIVVLEKYFPTFDVTITQNNFIPGEEIVGSITNSVGEVSLWDRENEILKVDTFQTYVSGELVTGKRSGTVAEIVKVTSNEIVYRVESTSVVEKGWKNEVGFLNNFFQKIQDGDYYQNFSYSIRSRIPIEKWEDPVQNLNHLSGFKKFSDLVIESSDLGSTGISTSQDGGDFLSIAYISEVVDTNCVFDFDIALDETSLIGTRLISNGMIFNSRELQDYEESIGNRVLVIDDIGDLFNDRPRPNPYSVITTFKLEEIRSRKFIVFTRDKRFTSERQIYLVTFIHNGTQTYLNQYGRVETGPILGSFDFDIFGDEGRLLFYPVKYRVNNYDLSFVSYDVKDYISGVGNTSIGNIVDIRSTYTPLNAGITTTIASIPLDYRSSKILVQIEDTSTVFEFEEITVIHDGTNVEIIDYGQITTDSFSSSASSPGIGTYNAYISGNNLIVDLIPSVLLDADVNTLRVSIASSESGYVTGGDITLNTSQLKSYYTGISTTTSTQATKIAEFENGLYNYNGGYLIVSIEDLTNNRYQVSEIVIATDDVSAYNSEFGILSNNGEIGIITSGVNGSFTELYFTADSEIDCEVRVFSNTLGLVDTFNSLNEINLLNARISTGYGSYQGTDSDIKTSFDLYHRGNPIFQKKFNGESELTVNIPDNLIELPQHFFVTGESVTYTYGLFNEPIGIATTSIPGIGLTDKLPEDLYIVKETDLNVKFATSAENALKLVPEVLTITSVGYGSDHYITARKQNAKALITIDNMIQSPIVSTSTTSALSTSIVTTDDIITLSGNVEFFSGGDFIKINDEIMRVSIVGYGTISSQIYVNRPWMGTLLQNHSAGDLVTKVVGNYNIVENTINFASAPYGKYPLGLPENRPDSRDWTGITTHSTFSGRTFMRSGITDSLNEPYEKNYVFDGIQDQFNGITTAFTLSVDGNDVTGIEQSNALITIKDIFQSPRRTGSIVDVIGNYFLEEDAIEEKTTLYFEGNQYSEDSDISVTGLPVSGKIVSVGSSNGFGYQTLVAAAGTAVVSSSGTIQSIEITNVGSGYRSGIQTVSVGVRTSTNYSDGYDLVGIASVSYGRIVNVTITNPGSGFTHSNPPEVVFDDPLSYSNLDLEYSSTSIGKTTGQKAKVNVVVGQGSSVIDFEIINPGFGYEINNTLTIGAGGSTGIPREYRGRLLDGANLLTVNKEFIKNEVVGFITTTYPSITSNPDYDETVCKRDIGYIVDAISNDLAFGGNYYSIQAGFAYWNSGTTYVDGEKVETISGYDYITDISKYIINNITVPVSYQTGISSVSQIKDVSIDFDSSCNPSAYDENCCSDVWYTIGNYVGIITTIIGVGTASAPKLQSPYANPTLTLPTTKDFEEFSVTIFDTDTDEFTAWTVGDLTVLDDISSLFDGVKTKFPIKIDGIQKSIKARSGSLIDIQATLLVFINDILQVPGIGYKFRGGSIIRFPEPPKPGNTAKILFYKGTGDIDVRDVDILETVKPGDRLRLHSDFLEENQSDRSVKNITSTDSVETFPYGGEGIISDPFLERPVNWCKQNSDLIVDGEVIPKSRDLYEAQINPFTNIISDISIGSTFVYVESIKTFFDDKRENASNNYTNTIDVITQDEISEAYASALVSAGIVTGISIQNSGKGYTTIPTVTIQSPNSGFDVAQATATIVDGKVDTIVIDDGGSGYDDNNPPLVLISPPLPKGEVSFKVEYSGDFGFISGIGTTTVGLATTALVFELFIPEDSPLKDGSVVDEVYDQSTIQIGDYFVIKSTNIGYGLTSLDLNGNVLVSGNTYIDNVYQVADIDLEPYEVNISELIVNTVRYASFSIGSGSSVTVGSGATLIVVDRIKVVSPIEDLNGLDINEFLSRDFFGDYTWGKVSNMIRPNPEEYSIYRDNGLSGISTSPIVRRTNALKYLNYLS